MKSSDISIAVIGLGYVGLPLSIEFSKKYDVVGFDKNHIRINQLKRNEDITKEITKKQISNAKNISFTTKEKDINEMIIKGKTKEELQKIISDNTYSGLSAITQLNSYKRC